MKIGIFDSGVGGLTILKEILKVLPRHHFIYLGDTLRTPYGNRSPETIARLTRQSIDFLFKKGAEKVLVACGTSSSVGLPLLSRQYRTKSMSLIEPLSQDIKSRGYRNIIVSGTRATINSGIFQKLLPAVRIEARPMPLLVPLAEEGLDHGKIAELTIRHYLDNFHPHALVLACTHFPLFMPLFRKILGKGIYIQNPGQIFARAVSKLIPRGNGKPRIDFYTTDNPGRFNAIGSRFLGKNVEAKLIQL